MAFPKINKQKITEIKVSIKILKLTDQMISKSSKSPMSSSKVMEHESMLHQ